MHSARLSLLRQLSLRSIHSFSRSLRENEPKEGRYPQGPLNVVDFLHDSAKRASLDGARCSESSKGDAIDYGQRPPYVKVLASLR